MRILAVFCLSFWLSLAHGFELEDGYDDEAVDPDEKLLGVIESLREKQTRFTKMLAQLINHATLLGFDVTLGDAYRDPRAFGEFGEDSVYGSTYSAHKLRLAIDLNLFYHNKYLTRTEHHKALGDYWESIGGYWGGRNGDGNHYALSFSRAW
ncbi:MAG: M15 family metallopeptidase [Shewanella sp.]|nr:M15 family metallopeptidase [Shewanella sp.]